MVDILICVNASREIGMGHLFRCLNLAKYLRKKYDKEIVFFSLDFKPAIEIIQENHFPVFVYDGTRKQNHELEGVIQETKPKLIINDMLDTEPKMIELQKKYDATVCNFDDTKAGLIFADVTINPLVFHYPEMRGKKPKSLYFYGPDYMILDERFENFRNIRELQNQKCRKILVSMGGTDTWNVSEKVVRALIPLITEKDLDITLSTGPGIQNQEKLCNLIEDVALTNLNCVQDVPWLGQLMAKSDILVCGGGITLYESAFLGKPMLAVANEPHEITNIQYFASKGAAKYVGFRNEWNDKAFSDTASVICTSAKIREDMHRSGLKLVDGKGLQRVSKILVDLTDE